LTFDALRSTGVLAAENRNADNGWVEARGEPGRYVLARVLENEPEGVASAAGAPGVTRLPTTRRAAAAATFAYTHATPFGPAVSRRFPAAAILPQAAVRSGHACRTTSVSPGPAHALKQSYETSISDSQ